MASEASTTKTEYAHIVHTPGLLGGEAPLMASGSASAT